MKGRDHTRTPPLIRRTVLLFGRPNFRYNSVCLTFCEGVRIGDCFAGNCEITRSFGAVPLQHQTNPNQNPKLVLGTKLYKRTLIELKLTDRV